MDEPFKPHPNWDDRVNDNITRSEAEGGAWLKDLAVGKQLSVVTRNQVFVIQRREDGLYISDALGMVPVTIAGSTWGGSMLRMKFIGIGMFMEYRPATSDRVLLSAEILDIQESNS
jgi:hypothetical protein